MLVMNFFVLGLSSILTQTILFREFLVIFYGNEIIIGVFFAGWFLWIALGALLFNKTRHRITDGAGFLITLEFVYFPILVLQLLFIRMVRLFIDVPLEAVIPFDIGVVISLVLTSLPGTIIGYTFPLATKCLKKKDGTFSTTLLYISESAGAITGGILFSYWAVKHFTHPTILIFLLLIGWFLLTIFSIRLKKRAHAFFPTLGTLVISLLLIMNPSAVARTDKSFEMLRWNSMHPRFQYISSKDSKFQHISIGKLENQYSIIGDGHFITSFPEKKENEKLAAIIMSEHPAARRLLILGFTQPGLLRELLVYPVKQIDVVTLDRVLYDLMIPCLNSEDKSVYKDKRVNNYFEDGRLFVNRKLKMKSVYDVIYISLPDPATAFTNRYFTDEFIKDCKSVLSDTGIYMCEVTSAENYFNREVSSFSGSIYKTLKNNFKRIAITPGEKNIFIAGSEHSSVTDDFYKLIIRYNSFETSSGFPSSGFRTVFLPERLEFTSDSLEKSAAKINRDYEPVTYFYNLMLWSNYAGALYLKSLLRIHIGGISILWIPLIWLFLYRLCYTIIYPSNNKEIGWNSIMSMSVLGGISMALEIMFLYLYQSLFGYVFEKIGVLVAVFMLGLGGGALTSKLIRFVDTRLSYLMAGLFGVVGIWIKISEHIVRAPNINELSFYMIITVTGFFTGLTFAISLAMNNNVTRDISAATGHIDAADHIGASIGSFIVGSLMMPMFGFSNTSTLLASICLFALLLNLKTAVDKRPPSRNLEFSSFPTPGFSQILIAITVSVLLMTLRINHIIGKEKIVFDDRILSGVSSSDRFVRIEKPFTYYIGKNQRGETETVSFGSIAAIGKIRGYGGTINLLISYDTKGKVRGVLLAHHSETPSYIAGIDDWLKGFKDRDITDYPFKNEPPHALTGATITGDAVVDIINSASMALSRNILNLNLPEYNKSITRHNKQRTIQSIVIVLCFILSLYVYLRFGRKMRLLILIINTVILGFYMNSPFTLVDLANLSIGNIPGWHNSPWLILTAMILITIIFFGPFYCGYICPFGGLQEILSELCKKLRIRISEKLDRHTRYIKYVLLCVSLILFWVTGKMLFLQWSPMQFIFSGHSSPLMLLCISTVLILCIFFFRFWCRYFCPAGAFFTLFNKISLFERILPRRVYNRCDLGVEGHFDIDCLKCNRCTLRFTDTEKNDEN